MTANERCIRRCLSGMLAAALRLGAVAISRHHDRALVRAVIRQAKAQGRGELS